MPFLKENIFGLDIGYETIKVIQLKRAGSLFKLVTGGASLSPREPFSKINVKDKKALSTAIKKAINDFHISSRLAVSALPESLVFTKIIQMPKMTPEELANAVPLETASFIPFEPEQTYLDFQIITDLGKNYEILVIAAPKTLVDDIIETLKVAGLSLVALETKPLANIRALIAPVSREISMILDIGAQTSSLTICEGSVIKFTATMSIGSHILQRIITSLSKMPQETEILKGKKAIETILDSLTEKALDGVKYYQAHKGKKIQQIFVVGGGAKMPGLTEHLTKKLGIKTEPGNPWRFIVNPPKQTDTLQGTTAIGLAMRAI